MVRTTVLIIGILLLAIFLRYSKVTESPPSLYWEEVALGYDAFSILKTGKDHHGTALPFIAFESFGDWKPSLYFYYLVPFIAAFGLNDLAVRTAGVLAGLLVVAAVGILARKLKLPMMLGWLIAAASPWSIMFSRAAWESHLATAGLAWAIVSGFTAAEKRKPLYLAISGVLSTLSMYTYHATRVIAPVVFLLMILLYLAQILRHKSKRWQLDTKKSELMAVATAICLFFVISLPLFWGVLTGNTELTHRFQSTSIFSDISIIEESNRLKEISGNNLLAKALYHRYVLYGKEVLSNVFSYFTLNYLLLSGDAIRRHSTGYVGLLYFTEAFFLVIGLFSWLRSLTLKKSILLVVAVFALIPASLSTPNPHALRTLAALPTVLLLITQGVHSFYWSASSALDRFKLNKKLASAFVVALIVSAYLLETSLFYRYLLKIYPVAAGHEWQYGYKEMVEALPSDRKVFVSRGQGRPAMYYWFYSQTDPRRVQAEQAIAEKDQSEFITFENLSFYRSPGEVDLEKGVIVAAVPSEVPQLEAAVAQNNLVAERLKVVKTQTGEAVWVVLEIK